MRLSDLMYELPEELIAQEPLADRAASRLLTLDRETGAVGHRSFREVVDLLEPEDVLVRNNTRVSALRLLGERPSGGQAEALLLSEGEEPGTYVALVRPGKRLKPGAEIVVRDAGTDRVALRAVIREDLGEGRKLLALEADGDWRALLQQVGRVPLPPYIQTPLGDRERYQTVYAQVPGSSAAPTAGLHFTEEILGAIAAKGVTIAEVTLDVGLDTFRPVQVEDLREHTMHGERCAISEETVAAVNGCRGRILAVGTTSVRTLESFAVGPREIRGGEMVTHIFLTPENKPQIVDGLFTNFHLPGTTMLAMLAAFTGIEPLMKAYSEAVAERYRFLSFGDSMLIAPGVLRV